MAPVIAAVAKGPDQINLTWAASASPGYGYLVEIQSANDPRYANWTELTPIPAAGGYVCNSGILINGASCTTSDATGQHVYTSPTNGVPYWVTESNYVDPQDGSRAQFIAAGLMPGTAYSFRSRAYSGNQNPAFSAYSNVVTISTQSYSTRYVSTAGSDSNDGTAADPAHAWATLASASGKIACGQELIVMGGTYQHDVLNMSQSCTPRRKVVVAVNPGDTAIIQSPPSGADQTINISGSHVVIDGIKSIAESTNPGEYAVVITGNYNAVFNAEVAADAVPITSYGVIVYGRFNLLYGSYVHDYGSPDGTQNPDGNGGFVLSVYGPTATNNVIWSNHLTRGGHDESLCKSGCSYNRWLNNIMDGGWGQGWNIVYGDNQVSQHNLFEGNIVKDVGQLVPFYKPAIQVSQSNNTVRRNVVLNAKSNAVEESALYNSNASDNLVYNNVFYAANLCLFQSSSSGVPAYDGDIFVNNICYPLISLATDIYLGNTTNQITNNDFLAVDSTGSPAPGQAIVIWNHSAQANFQYPQTLAYADANYSPPFANNKGLDVDPLFVDVSNLDFHLSSGSTLMGAGIPVTDNDWGSVTGTVDLGAFGISPRAQNMNHFPSSPVLASLVNGASYQEGAVAPGENVIAMGAGLGPAVPVSSGSGNGTVPTKVSGAQLLFDGITAPVLYAWGQQTSAMVPYEVAGKTTTTVQLVYQGVQSDPMTYHVTSAAPGIYTLDGSGFGAGAVLNQDGITVNSPTTPAQKGSVVSVFMTGGGITAPATTTGAILPANESVPPSLAASVTCTVGGVPATVRYAGAAPGLVSGMNQVNVKIPDTAPSGPQVPLVISLDSTANASPSSSQEGVTIAIE